MAGELPPKLRALLDQLRHAELPGDLGEDVRMQIDQVEAEVTDVMKKAHPELFEAK
jgi:hypothetical protein